MTCWHETLGLLVAMIFNTVGWEFYSLKTFVICIIYEYLIQKLADVEHFL